MKATKPSAKEAQSSPQTVRKVLTSISDKLKNMLGNEKPDLQDLFLTELKDIYWAEQCLVDELPGMAEKATTQELKQAIKNHLEETKQHVKRLEEVFALVGETPSSKKCEAMDGLVSEAKEMFSETKDETILRDVAIISAAQKVEHYEIATYGTLRTLAHVLGHNDVAQILNTTLEEEKGADLLLTQIAEGFVNEEAMEE